MTATSFGMGVKLLWLMLLIPCPLDTAYLQTVGNCSTDMECENGYQEDLANAK